jgi:hypothetical protein
MTMTTALRRPQMTDFNKAAQTTIDKALKDHDKGSSGGCSSLTVSDFVLQTKSTIDKEVGAILERTGTNLYELYATAAVRQNASRSFYVIYRWDRATGDNSYVHFSHAPHFSFF